MNEADFLMNIARRLGRSIPLRIEPPREVVGAPDFWQSHQLEMDERIDRFGTELEALGGHVTVCDGVDELKAGLIGLLAILNPGRIGTWGGDALADFDTEDVVAQFDCVPWGPEALDDFTRVDVGITGCAYAVADTGTLVMKSEWLRGRSVSVLPPVHIALVHEHQIRTRLGEVLEELSKGRDCMPSSVHFISGPSRSSDIENDSTIGIHGPAAVHVFVLRG